MSLKYLHWILRRFQGISYKILWKVSLKQRNMSYSALISKKIKQPIFSGANCGELKVKMSSWCRRWKFCDDGAKQESTHVTTQWANKWRKRSMEESTWAQKKLPWIPSFIQVGHCSLAGWLHPELSQVLTSAMIKQNWLAFPLVTSPPWKFKESGRVGGGRGRSAID